MTTMSLFGKQKLILIDEVDGLSGRKDRGGIPEIVKLIATSNFPIVCTANNPWDSKFSKLRSKCKIIEFSPLNYLSIFNILKSILEKESIEFEELALKSVARRAGGDARAAINDIQTLSHKGAITKESLEGLAERRRTESMFTALVKVFKNSDPLIALSAFDTVKEKWGTFDILVHSLAFADRNDLKGDFSQTSRAGFSMALDISAYSLVSVANSLKDLFNENGSIITMTYYGAEKVIQNYKIHQLNKKKMLIILVHSI